MAVPGLLQRAADSQTTGLRDVESRKSLGYRSRNPGRKLPAVYIGLSQHLVRKQLKSSAAVRSNTPNRAGTHPILRISPAPSPPKDLICISSSFCG